MHPRSTLSGSGAAAALGVGTVEVDAKLSRDGRVVLMHDDTWQRTTDG